MKLPKKVTIVDVGPRDGFQNEKQFIPTQKKIEIVNGLIRAGLKNIQVSSVVHPKAVPQLADAEEVMTKIDRRPDVSYRLLAPNLKGVQRALPLKPDKINLMMSVTESHNRSNANRSIDETLKEFETLVTMIQEQGIAVSGGMACGFGCPFEGKVSFQQIERVADRYLAMGIRSVGIADTVGYANPKMVYDTMAHLLDKYPEIHWLAHIHNHRDLGLANILAAMQAGLTEFGGAVSNHPHWRWQAAGGVGLAALVFGVALAKRRGIGGVASATGWLRIAAMAIASGATIGWTIENVPLESLTLGDWLRSLAWTAVALMAPLVSAAALASGARPPIFAQILGRAEQRPRRAVPLSLGLILLVTVVLSAQAALGLVFDGRYRDFPFAPLTAAAVPLLALATWKRRSNVPAAEKAMAVTLAVSAVYIVGNESFANWQALWFAAALLALALTLVQARDVPS